MPYTVFLAEECNGANIAPGASADVQQAIDLMIAQVRCVCKGDSFVVISRNDGGLIFVPTLGSSRDKNLLTVWPLQDGLDFDIRSQPDRVVGRRRFPDLDPNGHTFIERLQHRFDTLLGKAPRPAS